MRIRRRTAADSTRAKRSAEPVMRKWRVAEKATTPTVGSCDGDRKSADARGMSVAAKDTRTAVSELWKLSRRDFATRFQWRTARLVFEDVDITRKSLW